MKRYAHYSFDLWGTLIKSNPQFKKERARFIFQHYNPTELKLVDVEIILQDVGLMCHMSNEWTEQCVQPEQMYAMVFQQMGCVGLGKHKIRSIMFEINTLFYKYHPTLWDDDTELVLSQLHKEGSTLSILSNTGYMGGAVMREVLRALGISHLFKFALFSDELCSSKPSFLAYQRADALIQNSFTGGKSNVLHVGDSDLCDGRGAIDYGYDSYIVHSTKSTLLDLIQ